MGSIRVAMILAGLGRTQRGAEAAFLELAGQFRRRGDVEPVLFGAGEKVPDGLEIRTIPCPPRDRFRKWPKLPAFRGEYEYEEFIFSRRLAASGLYRPADFDVVIGCTYPHINWYVRRAGGKHGPAVVFVTQNGDWMARARNREYRYFRCDGLVCTNPVFYERNRERHRAVLIPNGVDPEVFHPRGPGDVDRAPGLEGVPAGMPLILIVSALSDAKGVADGVRAAALVPDAFLAIAGDGPERDAVADLAARELPGRHAMLGSLPRERMAGLFRSADAFLHMSRVEPSALVYLEAAATGLPMVIHDSEVTRWTLGDAAIYADTASIEAVAAGLRRALGPEGPALGSAARRRVERDFSWEVLAGRYRDFFDEVLAARARPAASGSAS